MMIAKKINLNINKVQDLIIVEILKDQNVPVQERDKIRTFQYKMSNLKRNLCTKRTQMIGILNLLAKLLMLKEDSKMTSLGILFQGIHFKLKLTNNWIKI